VKINNCLIDEKVWFFLLLLR